MPYTLRHNKSTECIPSDFFLFLLLESFDIRKNMFRRWQEDGGSSTSNQLQDESRTKARSAETIERGLSMFLLITET